MKVILIALLQDPRRQPNIGLLHSCEQLRNYCLFCHWWNNNKLFFFKRTYRRGSKNRRGCSRNFAVYWLFSFHLAEHLHKHFLGLFSGNKLLIPLLVYFPSMWNEPRGSLLRAGSRESIRRWAPGMLLPKHLPDSITPPPAGLACQSRLSCAGGKTVRSQRRWDPFISTAHARRRPTCSWTGRRRRIWTFTCSVRFKDFHEAFLKGPPANARNCG